MFKLQDELKNALIDVQKTRKIDLENHQTDIVVGLAPGQAAQRILVADDVDDNMLFIVKLLKITGFEVQKAENGNKALEVATECCPDLNQLESTSRLSRRQLKNELTQDQIDELRNAVIALDTSKTMSVLQKIVLSNSACGNALVKLAENLDYEAILWLLDDVSNE